MQVTEVEWSKREKQIAQAAFERAFEREVRALMREVSERAQALDELDDMWNLHDFLSAKRHEIDGKYDNCEAALIFVFASLIQEGWLHIQELEGLASEKLRKISALTRM
jgi:hypothetical protein